MKAINYFSIGMAILAGLVIWRAHHDTERFKAKLQCEEANTPADDGTWFVAKGSECGMPEREQKLIVYVNGSICAPVLGLDGREVVGMRCWREQ